jgi:hypothetical protein
MAPFLQRLLRPALASGVVLVIAVMPIWSAVAAVAHLGNEPLHSGPTTRTRIALDLPPH